MIFVITNRDDITSDFIIHKMNEKGISYYRFNTEQLCKNVFLDFNMRDDSYFLRDKIKDIVIDLKLVKSVYFRRPMLGSIDTGDLSLGENQFILSEKQLLLEGLYKLVGDCFWISNVYSIREAENKIYQQCVAKELGFLIPHGIITSDHMQARFFLEKYKDCIVKPLKTGFIDGDNPMVIFTNRVSLSECIHLDQVQYCPTFFQIEVPKKADIRVTVVKDQCFAMLIESQEYPEAVVDWRRGSHAVKQNVFELPFDVSQKCKSLVAKLGLNFGAIDLVLDKNGDYIFLEINPNGQWAWMDKQYCGQISESIVDALVFGVNT